MEYRAVRSARRTPELGRGAGWEYRVQWESGEETWEPEWSLLYGRAGRLREECAQVKRSSVTPSSLWEIKNPEVCPTMAPTTPACDWAERT